MNEFLPGVTGDDPYALVRRPFRQKSKRSRSFYLDAPGGTIRAIQSILRIHGQKVIPITTSAAASSILGKV